MGRQMCRKRRCHPPWEAPPCNRRRQKAPASSKIPIREGGTSAEIKSRRRRPIPPHSPWEAPPNRPCLGGARHGGRNPEITCQMLLWPLHGTRSLRGAICAQASKAGAFCAQFKTNGPNGTATMIKEKIDDALYFTMGRYVMTMSAGVVVG